MYVNNCHIGDYNYFNNRYLHMPTVCRQLERTVCTSFKVSWRLYDRKSPPNSIAIIEAAKSSVPIVAAVRNGTNERNGIFCSPANCKKIR
jgi:hypothetical protein